MNKIVNGVASEYEIPITKKDITFYGNTKEEKKANEMIFDLSMTIDRQQQELDQYKNNWEELKKEFMKKVESVRTIKNMLGDNAKVVNPHIDILEIEYNYFLNKIKELEEGK